jgi:hypothetical protein
MKNGTLGNFNADIIVTLKNRERIVFEHGFVFRADSEQELQEDRKRLERFAAAWIELAPEVHNALITQAISGQKSNESDTLTNAMDM